MPNEAPRPPSPIDRVAPFVEAAVHTAAFALRVAVGTSTAVALAWRPRRFEREYAYDTLIAVLSAARFIP